MPSQFVQRRRVSAWSYACLLNAMLAEARRYLRSTTTVAEARRYVPTRNAKLMCLSKIHPMGIGGALAWVGHDQAYFM